MKRIRLNVLAAIVLGLAACASPERTRNLNDPTVAPKTMALQVCSACHGVSGNSISPNFPHLAGQTPEYLVSQLTNFRKHSRSDPAGFEYMWGLSRHLTDEQVKGLAAYFSAQKRVVSKVVANREEVAAGEAIFKNGVPDKNIPGCFACHGDHGQGNGQTPRLAGQHADYLQKQLMVFQRTDERPEGAIMKVIAHDLTETNMKDVSEYLQSLALP